MREITPYPLRGPSHGYYFRAPLCVGFRYIPSIPVVLSADIHGWLHVPAAPTKSNDPNALGLEYYSTYLDKWFGRFPSDTGPELAREDSLRGEPRAPGHFGTGRDAQGHCRGVDYVLVLEPVVTLLSLLGGDIKLLETILDTLEKRLPELGLANLAVLNLFLEMTDRGLKPYGHLHLRPGNAIWDENTHSWRSEPNGPAINLEGLQEILCFIQMNALDRCGYRRVSGDGQDIDTVADLDPRTLGILQGEDFASLQLAKFLARLAPNESNPSQRAISSVAETLAKIAAKGKKLRIYKKLYTRVDDLYPFWLAQLPTELVDNLGDVVRKAQSARDGTLEKEKSYPRFCNLWPSVLEQVCKSPGEDAVIKLKGEGEFDAADWHRHTGPDLLLAGVENERWDELGRTNPATADRISRAITLTHVVVEALFRRALWPNKSMTDTQRAQQEQLAGEMLGEHRLRIPGGDAMAGAEPAPPTALPQQDAAGNQFVIAFENLAGDCVAAVEQIWQQNPLVGELAGLNMKSSVVDSWLSALGAGMSPGQSLGAELIAVVVAYEILEVIYPLEGKDVVNWSVVGLANATVGWDLGDRAYLDQVRLGQRPYQQVVDYIVKLVPDGGQFREKFMDLLAEKAVDYYKRCVPPHLGGPYVDLMLREIRRTLGEQEQKKPDSWDQPE